MKLIEYDGMELKVADEALLVRPFRELFNADRSRGKEQFIRQMSYLWFMVDPRSPYVCITDEAARAAEVKAQEGFPEDWEPSEKLREAMERYAALTVTTQALLLQSTRKAMANLRRFLETVDLLATDDHGKPIYQVSAITTALKQMPELSKALAEAEKALAKDFEEEGKARGSLQKSVYEDGMEL